jgi:hypothetical protein
MGRNDSQPIKGSWGLLVSITSWLLPMGVYQLLRWQFGGQDVWPQVGPVLLAAFQILIIFGQMGALLLAALAWPHPLARWTVGVATILFLWSLYALFLSYQSVNRSSI